MFVPLAGAASPPASPVTLLTAVRTLMIAYAAAFAPSIAVDAASAIIFFSMAASFADRSPEPTPFRRKYLRILLSPSR
jgi:hypothetical protein